jgi:hypothetical protein
MNNKYIIVLVLILGISACNETEPVYETSKTELKSSGENENNGIPSEILAQQAGFVKLKGRPYRATEERERDLKNCGCKFCFGVCEVEFELDLEDILKGFTVAHVPGKSTATFYLTEPVGHNETEFGVDNFLILPSTQTGFPEDLSLDLGVYHFVHQQSSITFNGETQTTYGYVILNVTPK